MHARVLLISTAVSAILVAAVFLAAGLFLTPGLAFMDINTPKSPATPAPVRLIFVGDVMLARDVELRLLVEEPGYAFKNLEARLKGDVVLGNFEASIPKTHKLTPIMTMRFSVRPELSNELALAGFTHLSLANNHAFDYGVEGYRNTISVLESQGLEVAGNSNLVADTSSFIKQVGEKDILITNINATYGTPNIKDVVAVSSGDITSYDLSVAYVHWGEEYEPTHSLEQQRLAHQLIDNGFDVVIGHHPHVVQDIESYKKGIIFYSLGNFIFDQYWNEQVQQGLLLDMVSDKNGWNIELVPVESKTVRVQPREMGGQEREVFLTHLSERSSEDLRHAIAKGRISLQF